MTNTKKSAQHVNWEAMPKEQLNDDIQRRLITGDNMMIAHVYIKAGGVVPMHSHHNEQITYILDGALKFLLGENQDEEVIVRAGEVLVIPPHLPHSATALEDTVDVDVFNPPREDWLDGTDAYLRDGSSK
jgi:quercetin dioxygenase-like cupin family protein